MFVTEFAIFFVRSWTFYSSNFLGFTALIRDICGRESQEDGSWCDLVEKALRLSDKVMTEIQQNPNKGIMEQVGYLFLKFMSILQAK